MFEYYPTQHGLILPTDDVMVTSFVYASPSPNNASHAVSAGLIINVNEVAMSDVTTTAERPLVALVLISIILTILIVMTVAGNCLVVIAVTR